MFIILAVAGAFVAYRLYARPKAVGMAPVAAPALPMSSIAASSYDPRIQAEADRFRAEILGRFHAAEAMALEAERHTRAADAARAAAQVASGSPPKV